MAWFIGQSIVIIAAAFLLGILVGWLIWGRMLRPKPALASEAEAPASVVMAAAAGGPAAVSAGAGHDSGSDLVDETLGEPEDEMASAAVSLDEAEPVGEDERAVGVEAVAETDAADDGELVAALGRDESVGAGEPAADDLERIEGIGPRMAGALRDAGIRTYGQLAGADEAALRRAIEAHGLRFAPSIVTWGRQAQLLADGDEEGFADLTRRLVAGRDEGRE